MMDSSAEEIVEEFNVLVGESVSNAHENSIKFQTLRYNFKPESLMARSGVMESREQGGAITVRFQSASMVCLCDW